MQKLCFICTRQTAADASEQYAYCEYCRTAFGLALKTIMAQFRCPFCTPLMRCAMCSGNTRPPQLNQSYAVPPPYNNYLPHQNYIGMPYQYAYPYQYGLAYMPNANNNMMNPMPNDQEQQQQQQRAFTPNSTVSCSTGSPKSTYDDQTDTTNDDNSNEHAITSGINKTLTQQHMTQDQLNHQWTYASYTRLINEHAHNNNLYKYCRAKNDSPQKSEENDIMKQQQKKSNPDVPITKKCPPTQQQQPQKGIQRHHPYDKHRRQKVPPQNQKTDPLQQPQAQTKLKKQKSNEQTSLNQPQPSSQPLEITELSLPPTRSLFSNPYCFIEPTELKKPHQQQQCTLESTNQPLQQQPLVQQYTLGSTEQPLQQQPQQQQNNLSSTEQPLQQQPRQQQYTLGSTEQPLQQQPLLQHYTLGYTEQPLQQKPLQQQPLQQQNTLGSTEQPLQQHSQQQEQKPQSIATKETCQSPARNIFFNPYNFIKTKEPEKPHQKQQKLTHPTETTKSSQ